ncbi:MAG: enoyl-CoA hydratase/isomerase family protein [Pseudobdellovibrionaceae bacterium]
MDNNYKTILIDQKPQGIWILTVNRPEALNALNSTVLNEMSEVLRQIGEMPYDDARALIITGAGEKSFVAGADIKEINALDKEKALVFAQRGQSIFHELSLLKIPVIAAVNGFALGGGCELALGCDFIYASENAKFGLPEVSLGLIPGFGGTVRLARAMGPRRSCEWTFTGGMMTAQEACSLGLVNKVLPQSELMPAVLKTVEAILSKAPLAVSAAKKSINEAWDMDIDEAQKNEAEIFAELFNSEDVKEGTNAFIEKRKAQFKGH